jgi:ABC-type branched-subunit amino acid transport system ATPase component
MSRTFQHVRLLRQMSVLENVAIGAHLRGSKGVLAAAWRLDRAEERACWPKPRARSSASASPSTCSNRPAAWRWASSASSRSPARCAADPCLLLLDEPAAGLRYKEKEALADLLRKLRAEGMASCWSSTTWISSWAWPIAWW